MPICGSGVEIETSKKKGEKLRRTLNKDILIYIMTFNFIIYKLHMRESGTSLDL